MTQPHHLVSWEMGKMQVLKDNKQARHFRGQLRETEQVQTEHCVSSYLGHEDQSSFSEMKKDGCWGCHVFFKNLFCASQETPRIFFMSLLWEGFLKCNEKNAPYKWRGGLGNESTFYCFDCKTNWQNTKTTWKDSAWWSSYSFCLTWQLTVFSAF